MKCLTYFLPEVVGDIFLEVAVHPMQPSDDRGHQVVLATAQLGFKFAGLQLGQQQFQAVNRAVQGTDVWKIRKFFSENGSK